MEIRPENKIKDIWIIIVQSSQNYWRLYLMLDYVENITRAYVLWKLKVHQILTAHLHKLPSSLGEIFFLHKSSSKNNSCKDEFLTKL